LTSLLAFQGLQRHVQDMSDGAHAYELPADQTVPAEQVWAELGIDDRG
jgi:hypothetical protein